MENKKFGSLLIFDLKEVSGDTTDKITLNHFINTLVYDIMEMSIIGTPQFEYFPYNAYNIQRNLVGYSITTIISLSSITIHICDIPKTAYIDIFTCCEIDNTIIDKIESLIREVFKPTTIYHKQIDR